MTAEHSVLHDPPVADGPNLRIWNREKRIRANSGRLSTAIAGVTAHHAVHTDYSHEADDASSLNGAVPQRHGGRSCLACIGLHGGGNVFKPVVDKPAWNRGAQRQHEDFPRDTDAQEQKPWPPTGAAKRRLPSHCGGI